MTERIEIMFWFGSERNVRWRDYSRRVADYVSDDNRRNG